MNTKQTELFQLNYTDSQVRGMYLKEFFTKSILITRIILITEYNSTFGC